MFSKATRSISTIHPHLCPVTCGKKKWKWPIVRMDASLIEATYHYVLRLITDGIPLILLYGFFSLLVAPGCHRDPWSGPGVWRRWYRWGGWLHPPTLRQVAIHLLHSLLPGFAGYPVHPGTFPKGTKKITYILAYRWFLLERKVKYLPLPYNIYSPWVQR